MANEIIIQIIGDDGQIVKTLKGLEQKAQKPGEDSGKGFGESFTSQAGKLLEQKLGPELASKAKVLGVAALGLAAVFETVKFAFDKTLEGEKLRQTEGQFQSLTARAGEFGDGLKEALVKSSGGLLTGNQLLQSANKALIDLGGSASKLPALLEAARKSTLVFGGDLQANFETINQAIATTNTRSLRSVGLFIDQDLAIKKYAESIGVAASSLTQAGKSQAILNAVLEKSEDAFRNVDPKVGEVENSYKRMKVALEEASEASSKSFSIMFGDFFSKAITGFANQIKFVGLNSVAEFGHGVEQTTAKSILLANELKRLEAIAPGLKQLQDLGLSNSFQLDQTLARIKQIREEKLRGEAQDEKSFLAQLKRDQAAGKRDLNADKLFDAEKEQAKLDKLSSDIRKIKEDSVNAQLESATAAGDVEKINLLSQQKAVLINQEFAQKKSEIRRKFHDENINDEAALNEALVSLNQTRNARLEALDRAANVNSLKLKQIVQSGIIGGLTNSFAALGGALVKNQNGFEAFGKAVIGALGAMAIQIGTLLLTIGIGFQALGPVLPVFGLSGAAAIAAGLGLIVLGGALSAVGGSGGGESSGGSASGGAASTLGNGGANAFSQNPDIQRQRAGTEVNINVNGGIFDSPGTGLRMADIIRQAGFESGVTSTI